MGNFELDDEEMDFVKKRSFKRYSRDSRYPPPRGKGGTQKNSTLGEGLADSSLYRKIGAPSDRDKRRVAH